jgi:tetratricopeptide (TPR) repeat protein
MDVGFAFLTVFKVAVCALIFGGAAWMIMSGLLNRTLTAGEAALIFCGLTVVMFLSMSYAVSRGFAALFALLLLGAGGYVGMIYYAKHADRKLNRKFDNEDIAQYLEAIELDPTNVAAHSLLADLYRRQGSDAEALKEYEIAVKLSPGLQEERYWVQRLRTRMERGEYAPDGSEAMDTPCPQCGAIVPGSRERCQDCDYRLGKAKGM